MREILFKAKRVDNGEWVEGAYYKQTEWYGVPCEYHYIITSKDELEDNMMIYHEILPETLCEYTGLTDKNGKRIWENDIVKAPIYHDIGCYPYTETKIVKVQIPNIYRMSIDGDFEVIGNSIDNPELLTAER